MSAAEEVIGQARELRERVGQAGRYLAQGLRLMVGFPDFDTYREHMARQHPDQPAMTYEQFFRERQAARYGGADGRMSRCC